MRYITIILLILSNFHLLFAQQESRLNLVSSSGGRLSKDGNAMFYRPVYEHNGNTLSADSGYIYEDELKRQFFEAYSNVVITQPSGTVIYSDKLFYDASTQLAILTNNVKMIDATSTLTTNHLTYNMRSKYGTYSTGGRIVNQGDTITSQNAYYFEDTKDTYFRNKVIVRTPDVKIYTDTMRYNSEERITYFFGPTDIKGNKGENLYTEKGNYHTQNGIAKFSLNNLYTEGSRFLKSDSLYYEREGGIGKAYRNVVFVDTADKFYAYGGVGLYDQSDESITMTDKPLVISVVKDSVSGQDTLDRHPIHPTDSIAQDSILLQQEKLTDEELKEDQPASALDSIKTPKMIERADSIYLTADTLYSKMILLKDYEPLALNLSRDGGQLDIEEEIEYGDDDFTESTSDLEEFSSEESQMIIEEKEALISVQKDSITRVPSKDKIEKERRFAKTDSTLLKKAFDEDKLLRDSAIMPEIGKSDSLINEALVLAQTQTMLPKDSIRNETDTVKTRILKAYNNVRLFKSDLQAVADSVYYGEADSMFRFFGAPMIWAEGSQISADTIYMQVINNQLDNAFLKSNAFMVNAVLDTVKFNQLKGRKMTVFFDNNNIDLLYVDGNAENIVFSTNEKLGIITEMFHDRSSRIKILMKDKKIDKYFSISKIDQKVYPFKMVNQDNEILPGFIWKPQDRPRSKQDLLERSRNKQIVEQDTSSPVEESNEEKSEKEESPNSINVSSGSEPSTT